MMYTSFLNSKAGNTASSSRGFKNRNMRNAPPTKSELTSAQDNASLLKLSQRILGGKAVVKHVICDTAYVIYHEDFRQEFVIRQIPDDEDITRWIDTQTHTNIITAFDSFRDEMSGCHFSMVESNNAGNIFSHIKRQNLNMAIDVPRTYIEMIYDVAIQLAQGLDFAHNSGLVHGQFDLSKVVLEQENENIFFKITDFAPQSSMEMPLSPEASYWPFSKQKKQVSENEKKEVIMLKDIYTLGIAILELMIGRTSKQNCNISLDSLPLTWAEFPESTPLIQVLVECIQIDSITQRKGRLQNIKKLLIREYKKFFQKPIYKMESPYVGKKADVFNKRGIVALFHKNAGEALSWWSQARILSDRHFDSQCNFCMHRWSTGKISDAQLIAELSEFVFNVEGKGQTLQAFLLISMGEREQGMTILKQYIQETEACLKNSNRLQNLKVRKQLKSAQEVFNVVQLNKNQFFNNIKVQHEHERRVSCLAFSDNSLCLASICEESCKIWKVNANLIGCKITIPAALDEEQKEEKVLPLATVNNKCTLVALYRGKLMFSIYEIVDQENFRKKDTINLRRELIANGVNSFDFNAGRDKVNKLRFVGGDSVTHLRIYLRLNGEQFISNVQLSDSVSDLVPSKLYSDEPIFNIAEWEQSPQIKIRQENMLRLIEEQTKLGNELIFPSEDMRIVAVYFKENKDQKHYQIYDNLRDEFIRKVAKRTMFDEAVALNNTGTLIAFVEDKEITLRSIRMPNNATLVDNLRPRIATAESKLNPAESTLNRQAYKDKLYRELHAYHMFKENPIADKTLGLTEEQNIHLMVLKYEEGATAPYKLKANRELMMLQKVLLRDAVKTTQMKDLQEKCPLVGVEGTKRIEIYDDELTFSSKDSKIVDVAMSSEPHRNFFLIAMDGIVYKYDLVSKELLFQFQTNAKIIQLYDKDDKLVVANAKEIRLWDFYDHSEEAPELITAMQLHGDDEEFKVEKLFINKNSKSIGLFSLQVLATYQNKFILFKDRLEVGKGKGFRQQLDEENEIIVSAAFNKDSSLVLIGTSIGRILAYRTSDGELDGEPTRIAGSVFAVTQIVPLVNIEDNDVFLTTVANKELYVYIHNKRDFREVDFGEEGASYVGEDICNVQASLNNKFFMLGVPSKRAIGFFGLSRVQLTTKPLKWVTKYPFVNFYADDHLSTMMLIDETKRTLDFHYILWRFDTTKLDIKALNRLDIGPGADREEYEEVTVGEAQSKTSGGKKAEQLKGASCCAIF